MMNQNNHLKQFIVLKLPKKLQILELTMSVLHRLIGLKKVTLQLENLVKMVCSGYLSLTKIFTLVILTIILVMASCGLAPACGILT